MNEKIGKSGHYVATRKILVHVSFRHGRVSPDSELVKFFEPLEVEAGQIFQMIENEPFMKIGDLYWPVRLYSLSMNLRNAIQWVAMQTADPIIGRKLISFYPFMKSEREGIMRFVKVNPSIEHYPNGKSRLMTGGKVSKLQEEACLLPSLHRPDEFQSSIVLT